MSWSMKVTGSTRVANNMRTRAANSANTYPVTYAWAQDVRAKLKSTPYLSRLAHFKHKRTGALANGWAVVRAGKNAASIENRAKSFSGFPYPVVVVGNAAGKRVGRAKHPSFARWWIARDVIDAEIPKLRDKIADYVVNV